MNLIGNALKFTPKGGQVSITGVRGDEWVKIIVEDNGCGISEEYHEMIFQRFYRIPEAPNPPGSGLGLHIVKTYVDLHRGEVGVESKVGHGSTFTVSLPIKQDRQDTQANAEEKESTGS
jgi:signal transduction histidine kinase